MLCTRKARQQEDYIFQWAASSIIPSCWVLPAEDTTPWQNACSSLSWRRVCLRLFSGASDWLLVVLWFTPARQHQVDASTICINGSSMKYPSVCSHLLTGKYYPGNAVLLNVIVLIIWDVNNKSIAK